jgi:hypothetical protein
MNQFVRVLFKHTTNVKHAINHPLITNQYSTSIVKLTHRTRRGTKAGRNVVRPIRTVVSVQRKIKQQHELGVNMFNLVDITLSNNTDEYCIFPIIRPRLVIENQTLKSTLSNLSILPTASRKKRENKVSLVSLNPRSDKNKATSINDFILSNNFDILALTETWLGTTVDKSVISELTPC